MDLCPAVLIIGGLLGSGATLLAYPAALRHEIAVVRSQLVDARIKIEAQNRVVSEQADLIRQLRGQLSGIEEKTS